MFNKLAPAVAGAILVASAQVSFAEVATLRVVTAFPQNTPQNIPLNGFVDRVNETCTESVQLDFVGGPEAVPTFELGEAVRRGVVDVGYSSQSFYASIVPEAAAIKLSTNTVAEQRENGGHELLNPIHQERMNAVSLARTHEDVPFYLYLTEEADPLDLTGKSLRIAPVYRAFFDTLGAQLVQTPPSEMYTAVERGVVQGLGWTSLGIFDFGLQEHLKYRVEPGFYLSDGNVLVNLDKWNDLSEAAQSCLNEAAVWIEGQGQEMSDLSVQDLARQAEAGIEAIELTGEDREEFLRRASDAGWAEIEELAPENAAKLKELLAPDTAG